MKRKKTIVRPDGSKEIIEEDDQAPVQHKNELAARQQRPDPKQQYLDKMASQEQRGGIPGNQNLASQGQQGDTQLAHVNSWEEALLKRLGGAGTRNPHTGLKQFYAYDQQLLTMGSPKAYADEILRKQKAGIALTDPNAAAAFQTDNPQYFPALGQGKTPDYGSPTDMFNIPLDIMPTSTSASSSSSGLDPKYREQLMGTLMPQLQQGIADMPGNWDKYTNEALGSYQQMMNNALRTNIPKALAGLSNRGILNSTEGQGVLGNVYSQAAMDASNKGYTTAMQSAFGKAGMPTVLSQIAQLGQGTQSNQSSYASDPTVMYRDLSATIRAMMG